MNVRVTQLDGKLPNLALMKLAAYHRSRGDGVTFSRSPYRDLGVEYRRVYGSAIFSFSDGLVARFRDSYPDAIIGGTWNVLDSVTVEETIGGDFEGSLDYSIYPGFSASMGFTARGCRLKCGFCVVPKKEGKPKSVAKVADIWRGSWSVPTLADKRAWAERQIPKQKFKTAVERAGAKFKTIAEREAAIDKIAAQMTEWPRHLHLLDNDFFGQPREQWEARLDEIRTGGFKVCLNQGINIRMIDADSAKALASIDYFDDQFKVRRLYTAWDNLGDEERFVRGVKILQDHGVNPDHLLVYMLIGYDKRETWGSLLYRFNKMVALGVRPYPMVFNPKLRRGLELGDYNGRIRTKPPVAATLTDFQRWAIRKAYLAGIKFEHYRVGAKGHFETDQFELAGLGDDDE